MFLRDYINLKKSRSMDKLSDGDPEILGCKLKWRCFKYAAIFSFSNALIQPGLNFWVSDL
jgi:hypothetical protein